MWKIDAALLVVLLIWKFLSIILEIGTHNFRDILCTNVVTFKIFLNYDKAIWPLAPKSDIKPPFIFTFGLRIIFSVW